ncbi:MAG: glycosyltransferase family 39 protein [Planctomycetota bacterium]
MTAMPASSRFVVPVLLLAAALGLGLRLWRLDACWANNRAGYNGACYWGLFGLNYFRYGCAETKGAPFLLRLEAPGEAPKIDYYVRHPFAISVLVALSFHLFGPSEWAAQLVPLVFMLGALLLAWPVTCRLAGRGVALATVLLLAVLPMGVVYGQQVNSEGPLLFFLFLTLLPYLRYRESGSKRALGWALLAYFPATLFDWPALLLGPVLLLDALLFARRKVRALFFAGVPLATFLLFLAYAALVFTTPKLGIAHVLRGASAGTDVRNTSAWLANQATFLLDLYTPPVLGLAFLGLLLRLREWWSARRGDRPPSTPHLFLALSLFSVAVPVVFWGRSIDHDYYSFSYLPLVAIAAALALDRAWKWLAERRLAVLGGLLLFLAAALPTARSYALMRDWPDGEIQRLLEDPWIAAHTRPQDSLIAADPIFGYLGFYRDAVLLSRVVARMQLAKYRELMVKRAGADGRITYLVPLPLPPPLEPVVAELRESFPSQEVTLTLPRLFERGLHECRLLVFDLK